MAKLNHFVHLPPGKQSVPNVKALTRLATWSSKRRSGSSAPRRLRMGHAPLIVHVRTSLNPPGALGSKIVSGYPPESRR
jgi:hypothetical protein